jgi:hypothetical protein
LLVFGEIGIRTPRYPFGYIGFQVEPVCGRLSPQANSLIKQIHSLQDFAPKKRPNVNSSSAAFASLQQEMPTRAALGKQFLSGPIKGIHFLFKECRQKSRPHQEQESEAACRQWGITKKLVIGQLVSW